MRAFSRALGEQPGIELAALDDRSGQLTLGDWDQTAAVIGRFNRGRIDAPFVVNASNFVDALGKASPVTATSVLVEAHSHVYEALSKGARRVLVVRLAPAAAAISYAAATIGATTTFAASATVPGGTTFTIKHLGCHNDGIRLAVHADEVKVGGVAQTTEIIKVRLQDSDGKTLYEVRGSLTEGAQDESGQSIYLPDVSAMVAGDMIEWTIPAGGSVDPTDDCYGRDANGREKWVTSAVLSCFSEGGTTYATADYDRCVNLLVNASEDFGYIMGGGTRNTTLLLKLADAAYETNRQFIFDVPGEFTATQAIAFVDSLGFNVVGRDHYPQAYWAPFKSYDPLTGSVWAWGTSAAQVGYRCAKNRNVNAYGMSPKHEPIAGARGNVGRRDYRPLPSGRSLTEQDLSDLAESRIIPVIFQNYASGSFYAFSDAITQADSATSYRKLVPVAEMITWLDEVIVRYGREILMMSRSAGERRMKDFLLDLFTKAQASEWLVDDSDIGIPAFGFEVEIDPLRRAYGLRVNYWLHFNGLIRQIRVRPVIV